MASFNGVYPSMVPGPLRHRVPVILIKYELKRLLVFLLSDLMVMSSTRSSFSLGLDCSEKKDSNVFPEMLIFGYNNGS